MAAEELARLAKAERVDCTLCRWTGKGSEVADHDANPEHQRRRRSYLIDLAVQKVMGWRCPGRIVNNLGRSR